MSDEVEWISGRKVHSLLMAAGVYNPDSGIRDGLRIGKIRAQAAHAEIQGRSRYGHRSEHIDWDVPQEVWAGRGQSTWLELEAGNYYTGDYNVRIGTVRLTGLRFARRDVIDWFEIEETPVVSDRASPPSLFKEGPKDKGGAPTDTEKWANFAAVAVVLQHHSGIIHEGMKKAPVYERIADYASSLDLAIPSDTTVSKALDKMKTLSGLKHGTDGLPVFDEDGKPQMA